MAKETTSQIVSKYKCLIVNILAGAKITKPTGLELMGQLSNLWSDEEFSSLSLYAKEELFEYSDNKRIQLTDEYTVSLYTDDNGNKSISNKTEFACEPSIYWYEVKEICSNDGTMVIIKTPTDKVYLE
jgi:hypothetical protein